MSHLQSRSLFRSVFFLLVRLLSWNGCKDETLGFKTLKQTNSTRVTLPSQNKFKIAENSRVAVKLAHHDEYSSENKYARESEQYVSWRLVALTCEGLIANLAWLCQTLHRNRAAGPPHTHTPRPRIQSAFCARWSSRCRIWPGGTKADEYIPQAFVRPSLQWSLRDERLVCECRTNHHLPFPTQAFCDWESFKYLKLIIGNWNGFPSNSHIREWASQDHLFQFFVNTESHATTENC